MTEAKFYRTREKWGAFSNFARIPVLIDGKLWKTTEHYYQAMKFPDEQTQEIIRSCDTPRMAADLGRSYAARRDWDSVKELYMLIALSHKTEQHEDVKALLLETGDLRIVEESPHDYYWGCGKYGSGKNRLGELWMFIRLIIRSSNSNGQDPTEA